MMQHKNVITCDLLKICELCLKILKWNFTTVFGIYACTVHRTTKFHV